MKAYIQDVLTAPDVYAAIADPRRRAIIDLLATGDAHPVGSLVDALRLSQPAVSKHLAVLRKVGLVTVEKAGQHRLYRLNAQELQAVHAWITTFEHFWTHQISRIKERAERLARARHPRTT